MKLCCKFKSSTLNLYHVFEYERKMQCLRKTTEELNYKPFNWMYAKVRKENNVSSSKFT